MNNHNNAKYAFYYVLSLVALAFVAISAGMVAFNIINQSILDALSYSSYSGDGELKFAISALLIATPIFYILSSLINKGLKKGELDKESGIRRWLTYFILLVSSVVLLGVFISVILNFLNGELTSRSILKALTMFVISGAIFSYYFYENRRENFSGKNLTMRLFFIGSLVLVVAAFVSALFFVESPKTARNRRLDQNLMNNISNIESATNNFLEQKKRLPENLEELKNNDRNYLRDTNLVDPETKKPIEYKKTSEKSFELCANFRMDNREEDDYYANNKRHEAGYQCIKGEVYNFDKASEEKLLLEKAEPLN